MIGELGYYCGSSQIKGLWLYALARRQKPVILETNLFHSLERARQSAHYLVAPEKIFLHTSISFPPEDRVSSDLMRQVGRDFLVCYLAYTARPDIEDLVQATRFRRHPFPTLSPDEEQHLQSHLDEWAYAIVEHRNTNHRHIHVLTDCQNILTGQLHAVSHRTLTWLGELILRHLEVRHGLRRLECSWVVRAKEGRRGPRLATFYAKIIGRDGLQYIKDVVSVAKEKTTNWHDFAAFCQERDVEPDFLDGRLVFRYRGVWVKATQLGQEFTQAEIQRCWHEKGIHYPVSQKVQ